MLAICKIWLDAHDSKSHARTMAIDKIEDVLEKILCVLPPDITKNKDYLKGYIDCWADNNLITEDIRAELYLKYGEGVQIARLV